MNEGKIYDEVSPPYCYHLFDDDLSDEEKIIMLRVMCMEDEGKTVKIKTIAEDTGMDPFTVNSNLERLKEKGIINGLSIYPRSHKKWR